MSLNQIVFLWLDASLIKCKDTRSLTKISQSLSSVNYDFTLGDVKYYRGDCAEGFQIWSVTSKRNQESPD